MKGVVGKWEGSWREMQTKECGLYSGNRDPLTTFVKGSDMVKAPFLGRLILQ